MPYLVPPPMPPKPNNSTSFEIARSISLLYEKLVHEEEFPNSTALKLTIAYIRSDRPLPKK